MPFVERHGQEGRAELLHSLGHLQLQHISYADSTGQITHLAVLVGGPGKFLPPCPPPSPPLLGPSN
jgi:hypothetical protein